MRPPPTNDPTYYSLKLLKVCGLHPDSRSKLLNIYFCVNYFFFLCILTLASIGVVTTVQNNVFEAIENLQTVFLYIHLLGKYPNLFFKKPILSHLLEQRCNFWQVEDFPDEVRQECQRILTTTTNFVRYFIVVTFLVIMNFFLQPILTGDLPVRVYVPKGWFHVINLTYWYLIPVIIGSIYGSDLIFCSICVPVIVQFKLLKYKFENWSFGDASKKEFQEELRVLVDHQNFLVEYCKEINGYTNAIFLNQVIVSTAIICMQLFIVSQKEFLLPNKLKCLGYCSMEVIETAIYCFNAEVLSEASESIGDAVYNSPWYDTSVLEVRKTVTLVIAKSQKKIVFSGFGLVWINLKTFTQIFKTAMSFYSYLNTMVSFEHD
ncbi:hypothetical protein MTP99_004366 [Tenebrio molitor]|nr:hypothetical protein MTP99_004366 [Tenebrio molitor]